MVLNFAYAGPVIASIALNVGGSIIATACVYIYLHRDRLKSKKALLMLNLTKPLHGIVKKIAISKIKKNKAKSPTTRKKTNEDLSGKTGA